MREIIKEILELIVEIFSVNPAEMLFILVIFIPAITGGNKPALTAFIR